MIKFHFSIERWKFNKEYSLYVSTWGNVKDAKKKDQPVYANHGYLFVRTGKDVTPVHRLVMETFKPEGKHLTVDHIDHNKRNNHIKNLRWLSAEENANDNNREEIFKDIFPTKKANRKKREAWRKKLESYAKNLKANYNCGGFFTIQKEGEPQLYLVTRKHGREFARYVNEDQGQANMTMSAVKSDYCNPYAYNGFIYTWFPSYADYLRLNKTKEYVE
jgi:hypothetical protein